MQQNIFSNILSSDQVSTSDIFVFQDFIDCMFLIYAKRFCDAMYFMTLSGHRKKFSRTKRRALDMRLKKIHHF